MDPFVSIVVPAYNVEPFLSRCLRSLARQTYRNFEAILVDDASTDRTLELLEQHGDSLPSCKIIRHERNQGLSGARNTGLEAARGDYIGFVDSDDWVSPTFVETMVDLARRTSCDIAQVQYVIAPSESTKAPQEALSERVLSRDEALWEMLETEQFAVWSRLYKRALLDGFTAGDPCFPVGLTCEDRVANAKLISKAQTVAVTSRCEYFYFLNLKSISGGGLTSRSFDLLKADRLMLDSIRVLADPRLTKLAEARVAKGSYSLLMKWAQFGVTDASLDEKAALSFLRSDFEKNYELMTAAPLPRSKRLTARMLKDCPGALRGLFSLYNALPDAIKKR
ncbi:glycosyltransferase family 2 protein [Adlercreutzia sp. ZJ242]|uniref:glycosyltransferase family 2 protein n=1 Tax=Adlercreutzia sp. ZJ242 TaxID=2709409 RepID=UPI0013ED6C87|nr:glycosyltransferase family 2 protein [Adlercreutzia sp. ZJ242]